MCVLIGFDFIMSLRHLRLTSLSTFYLEQGFPIPKILDQLNLLFSIGHFGVEVQLEIHLFVFITNG